MARVGPVNARRCRTGQRIQRVIWLAVLVWAVRSQGQAASPWRVYRAADGLTESLTTAITISPGGNVWAKGELDAVSMLDGYTIQHIVAPGERNARVYQSLAGKIWSLYDDGVLEWGNGQWHRHPLTVLREEREATPFQSRRLPPLVPAEQDRTLLLLRDRLIEFHSLSDSVKVLRWATNTSLGSFVDMIRSFDDSLWITGTRGVAKVRRPLRRLTAQTPWQEHVVPSALGVQDLQHPLEDPDGGGLTMVAASKQSARRVLVHFDGRHWTRLALPNESIRFAWRSLRPGDYWVVTANSLLRLTAQGPRSVTDAPNVSQYFDVAVQPRGVFWLATAEGLMRYSPLVWRAPKGPAAIHNVIYSFAQGNGTNFWMLTESGLVERRANEWHSWPWPVGVERGPRPGDHLYAMGAGRLLAGLGERWWLFDAHRDQFAAVGPSHGQRLHEVVDQVADGRLGVVTTTLTGRTNAQFELFDGNQFEKWPEAPPVPKFTRRLFFLRQARNGEWWCGSASGVAIWRQGQWQKFGPREGYTDEDGLEWLETTDGHIVCGGRGKGGRGNVSEYDGRRWQTLHSGFDRISALVQTTDGSIWVATSSGLYRYFRNAWGWLDAADGLPSSTVYSVFEDRDRRLWLGTTKGVTRYFPDADLDPPRTLSIHVEQSGIGTPEGMVRLTYHGRDRWRQTPDARLLYSMRLDGGSWTGFTATTNTVYSDLGAGRHEFDVRCMDRNWNIEVLPAMLEFHVVLPWFRDQRLLIAVIWGLIVAAGFAVLAVFQHLRLRRSYAEVERTVQQRTQELRQAYEALAQGQKMTALGTLASGIAHDFNNILSIIKGSVQIIESNLADHSKIQTRLDRIRTVVEQGSEVVRAMLGFGRAHERQLTACDVQEGVQETIRLLGDRFCRDVALHFTSPTGLPAVKGVKDLMQQMLLNLILNGADAMGGKGYIQIKAELTTALPTPITLAPSPAPVYVALAVTDHGCGIAPQNLPRIFEPFFTTKALSRRRGAGLGLFMVYEFAREMGHGLAVESKVGHGSTFTLFLPTTTTEPDSSPSPANSN